MFAATGVTGGTMLKGVKRFPGGARYAFDNYEIEHWYG